MFAPETRKQCISLLIAGAPIAEIVSRCGVSQAYVSKLRKQCGLSPGKVGRPRISDDDNTTADLIHKLVRMKPPVVLRRERCQGCVWGKDAGGRVTCFWRECYWRYVDKEGI